MSKSNIPPVKDKFKTPVQRNVGIYGDLPDEPHSVEPSKLI